MYDNISSICKGFGHGSDIESVTSLNCGLINTTYQVVLSTGTKLLLQRINTNVFTKPVELMENIVNVTSYLREQIEKDGGNKERDTLTFLPVEDGKYYYCDDEGGYWRMYCFVDDAYTNNTIDSPDVFREAGRAFGKFQSLLADYPMDSLHETIENFHNTAKRFENFEKAIERNAAGRVDEIPDEIEFVLKRKEDASRLVNMQSRGELPLRVTHNDTKLNNVLFDNVTHKAFCVIDLDTVMPGLSLYDFGDSIRFGANTTVEDDPDLSKVSVDVELYKAYVEGYLESAAESLTQNEVSQLAFSAKLMTYECGMRFLTDYIDGDVYFKTTYPEHNLVRARNQFRLVEDIEKHMDELNKVTEEAYLQAIKK